MEHPEPRINQISIKIPTWFDDTNLWLKQVDAAFKISRPKITLQKTKYYHLLNSLPPHVIKIVADKLNPDTSEPYTTLTDTIHTRLAPTRTTAYDNLMRIKLDNRILFEVLTEMRLLSERLNDLPAETMKEAFLKAMPERIRPVLVPLLPSNSLDVLAEVADSLLSTQSESTISHISNTSEYTTTSEQQKFDDTIQDQLNSIQQQLDHLKLREPYQSPLYYYHRRYGVRAFRCQSPCNWKHHPQATRFRRNFLSRSIRRPIYHQGN